MNRFYNAPDNMLALKFGHTILRDLAQAGGSGQKRKQSKTDSDIDEPAKRPRSSVAVPEPGTKIIAKSTEKGHTFTFAQRKLIKELFGNDKTGKPRTKLSMAEIEKIANENQEFNQLWKDLLEAKSRTAGKSPPKDKAYHAIRKNAF